MESNVIEALKVVSEYATQIDGCETCDLEKICELEFKHCPCVWDLSDLENEGGDNGEEI